MSRIVRTSTVGTDVTRASAARTPKLKAGPASKLPGLITVLATLACLLVTAAAAAAQAPKVEEEFATNVASTSATLHAVVNPEGAATSYRFEDATGNGAFAPVGGGEPPTGAQGEVGEGGEGVALEVHVQGLSPSTAYRYRVIAESSQGTGEGGEQTITTQNTGGPLALPDGRQWELVSPPAKEGALIHGLEYEWGGPGGADDQASASGDAVVYDASSPTEAESQGYGGDVTVLSTHGQSGWSSRDITPPHERGTGPFLRGGAEYEGFSEDLSRAATQLFGPFEPLSPEARESTPYLRADFLNGNVGDPCVGGCFQPLLTAADTQPEAVFGGRNGSSAPCRPQILICGPWFMGGTPDLSHILIYAEGSQLTSTPGGSFYEWSNGMVRPVSVPPSGEQVELLLPGSTGINGVFPSEKGLRGDRYAISANGERVILIHPKPTGTSSEYAGPVYLRENSMQPASPVGPDGECTIPTDACTVRLDVPQGSGTTPSEEPVYITANREASRIFFLDSGRLTSESSTGGQDLYEYNLDAPAGSRLTDLSADPNPGEPAEVGWVLGASENGSYIYFMAAGALAPGAVHDGNCTNVQRVGEPDVAETCNVYVRHAGVTRLVAMGVGGGWMIEEHARVSPDGRWLAFMSAASLTGYDTRDAATGQPDEEVYLYDAETGKLVCASCNPTGARPTGGELFHKTSSDSPYPVVSKLPRWTLEGANGEIDSRLLYQSRFLFDSGRLFFESNDALVPQDVNGAQDLYQFEPVGVGSCTIAQPTYSQGTGGCVDLISSGAAARQGQSQQDLETTFVDASETGGNVFFLSAGDLLAQPSEAGLSLYDAHECAAAWPCASEAGQSPLCDTEASCRAAPSSQPAIFGAPASATLGGVAGSGPPSPSPVVVVKPKAKTRTAKLRIALRACARQRRQARAVCEKRARERYGQARPRTAAGKKGKR
ncbi:MAG TPA: hypothetical protein VNV42_15165 [Solirubrobacteraceae bacterium]|jgi:hypothetical protein|nr:hypothetical protein [Solirubrobacteraceae bacterium]